MNLKKIKNCKDEYCTELMLKMTDLIKRKCKISLSKRVFIFDGWNGREYFLCGNKVYIADCKLKILNDDKKISLESLYTVTIENESVVNFETVIPDDTIQDGTKQLYTEEDFTAWYNSPCETNEFVDISYSKAINFLQNYKKTTFKTDRYIFYIKRDNDLTWAFFIYAKDLKTGADLKIYTSGYYTEEQFPNNSREVFIEDLSNKLSKYQLSQCKKEFINYCSEYCNKLGTKNFYALEFVKQCIQPVEQDHGWFVINVFSGGDFEFENIWIDDFLGYDKNPYFLISDKYKNITKIAALDFLSPNYKSTKPYKSGTFKRNHWDIDKQTIERLMSFLKEPFNHNKSDLYKHFGLTYKDEDIKTNWQFLIAIYNGNTGNGHNKILPLDIPIPDYTKIV